jgi:hypothetical protein
MRDGNSAAHGTVNSIDICNDIKYMTVTCV